MSIRKLYGPLLLSTLMLGGIKGCDAYQEHQANKRFEAKWEQMMKQPQSHAWILDPKTGEKIIPEVVTRDTIYVKDIKNFNISDSLIKEGLNIDCKELSKLDSLMQSNYAKGLISAGKKATKAIK